MFRFKKAKPARWEPWMNPEEAQEEELRGLDEEIKRQDREWDDNYKKERERNLEMARAAVRAAHIKLGEVPDQQAKDYFDLCNLKLEILEKLSRLEEAGKYDAVSDSWQGKTQQVKHDVLCKALDCFDVRNPESHYLVWNALKKALVSGEYDKKIFIKSLIRRESETKALVGRALAFQDKIIALSQFKERLEHPRDKQKELVRELSAAPLNFYQNNPVQQYSPFVMVEPSAPSEASIFQVNVEPSAPSEASIFQVNPVPPPGAAPEQYAYGSGSSSSFFCAPAAPDPVFLPVNNASFFANSIEEVKPEVDEYDARLVQSEKLGPK